MSIGIDYGMGITNVDRANGIRYGVESLHNVTQAWCESSEADYGEPVCPVCGQTAVDPDDECNSENWECAKGACGDYACSNCETLFDADDAFGDEPNGFALDDGEYVCTQGGNGDCDIFILKSPYFAYGPYCSPCAPGAVYLPDASGESDDGVKAYCFGHDWYEGNVAPHKIYLVSTGEIVNP